MFLSNIYAEYLWVFEHEKEHWLKGLISKYTGQTAIGFDAEFIYNHVSNELLFLWLIETVGVSKVLFKKAMDAQSTCGASSNQLVGVIREIIPWAEIEKN